MSGYFGLNGGDSNGGEIANILFGNRFQNNVGNGTLTAIELYVDDATPTGNVRIGIYDDAVNAPNNLLLDAGAFAAVNGWVVAGGLALVVTNGTWYWLACDLQNANTIKYQTGGPAESFWYRDPWAYGVLPGTFGAATGKGSTQFVMRGYVTTAGGVTVPFNVGTMGCMHR